MIVEVDIVCTQPESFKSRAEFIKDDGGDMKQYLEDKIQSTLYNSFQHAAAVDNKSRMITSELIL